MSEILLDECLKELYLAQEAMKDYVELDAYREIFEADNDEVRNQVQQNENAKTNTESHLKKAIQALIDMIKKVISNIKNFFSKNNLKERRDSLNESLRLSKKKDPEIGKKKIKILDFGRMKRQSDELDKEIDDTCRKLDAGQDVPIDNIMTKITNFCSSGASAIAVSMGMEAALQAASSSQEMARNIAAKLAQDVELQEKLMNSVGKKEYKKFERDINCMGKKISLRRKQLEKNGYCAQSFEDAINKTYNECESIFKNMGTLVNVYLTNPEKNSDGHMNALQSNISMIKHLKNNKETVKPAMKELKDNHGDDMIRRIAGNEDVKNVMKSTFNMMKKENDRKHKAYVDTKKYEKKAIKQHEELSKKAGQEKKKNMSDQSMMSSLLGSYDPNSKVKDSKLANTAIDIFNRVRG